MATEETPTEKEEVVLRGYCWLVGSTMPATAPCIECGFKEGHPPIDNQDECGNFAHCALSELNGGRAHGHSCTLPYRHEKQCDCPEANTECLLLADAKARLHTEDEA